MTRIQRGHGEEGDARSREQGFEERDAPLRPILIAMAGFAALLLAGLTLPALLIGLSGGEPTPGRVPRAQPPAPRLLADPRGQRLRMQASEQHALRTGPEPIEKAMRDVADRGWSDGK